MIETHANGSKWVNFKDWTPHMMALASHFAVLPNRPGFKDLRSYELGIDRVATLNDLIIPLLFLYRDEIEYCPSEEEVLKYAKGLLKTIWQIRFFVERHHERWEQLNRGN